MCAHLVSPQKCPLVIKKRVFNKTWTTKYLFTEVRGKPVCLVCGEQIAVLKDYNLNRHYETKHAEKYKNVTDAELARTSEILLAKLQKQQGFFFFYQASHIQGCSSQDQNDKKGTEKQQMRWLDCKQNSNNNLS